MIQDPVLRWIVTALFLISAAECAYALATGRRSCTHVVGHLLHFVMAVAMAVMAWPRGAALPTTGPMLLLLVATVWFAVITLVASGHRAVNAYHASMMLAMAWMYAVMSGTLLPAPSDSGVHVANGAHGVSSMASMPGMAMPDMAGPTATSGDPPFIVGLNWVCTVGFAVAAAYWLCLLVVRHRADPTMPAHRFFGIACQMMMAAGMAVMFGVML